MFYQFQHSIMGLWKSWAGLFDFLPYGDPYIAFTVLFVVVAVSFKFLCGSESN